MAQTVQLNVSIKTREGVRTLKQLRGSLQEVRNQIKNFSTDSITKEMVDVSKVIEVADQKLNKFGDTLNGRKLSLLFENRGGFTELAGSNISGGGRRTGGLNSMENASTMFVSMLNRMNRAIDGAVRTINLANVRISQMAVRGFGGGGGFPPGGGSGGPGAGSGFGAGLRQIAGTAGFPIVDAATQLRSIFQDRRVTSAFSDSASQLFGLLGSIFGQSVSSIAGDIGKAFGEIGTIAFNTLTLKFRLLGLVLSSTVKALGVTLGLTLFGGFAGVGTALAAPVLLTIGAITAAIGSAATVIKELVSELTAVIQNLFKAAVATISATIKTLVTVFQSVGRIISAVWQGLWDGLVSIAKASFQ